jgi:hypothetical protein
VEPAPQEQQLASQEEAEEQGGEEAAEDELPPVRPGALHTVRDARGCHSRRQIYSFAPPAGPFEGYRTVFDKELTDPGTAE